MYTHAHRDIKYWFYLCLSLYIHPSPGSIGLYIYMYESVHWFRVCKKRKVWGTMSVHIHIYIVCVCSHITVMYFICISLYIYIYIPHVYKDTHTCVCVSIRDIYSISYIWGRYTHSSPFYMDKCVYKTGGIPCIYLCICVCETEIHTLVHNTVNIYGTVYRCTSP